MELSSNDSTSLGRRVSLVEGNYISLKDELKLLRDELTDMKRIIDEDRIYWKKRVTSAEVIIKELKGFQQHESDAIEFELQKIIEKYVTRVFSTMTMKPFEIKEPSDPITGETMTDLDAAFLLSELPSMPNYARLREHGIRWRPKKQTNQSSYIFMMGEAKHYINYEKVAYKLWQFDKMRALFDAAKRVAGGADRSLYDDKFIKTVERNVYLSQIDDFFLFFGAAYWEKMLLEALLTAVKSYKKFSEEFNTATPNKKVELYNRMYGMQEKWYMYTKYPERAQPRLHDDEIVNLSTYECALNFVQLVRPSGERYKIIEEQEPEGAYRYGGKRKTRKYIG